MKTHKVPVSLIRALAGALFSLSLLLAASVRAQTPSVVNVSTFVTSNNATLTVPTDIPNTPGDIWNLSGAFTSGTINLGAGVSLAGLYVSGNQSFSLLGTGLVLDPTVGGWVAGTDLAATGKLILGASVANSTTAPAALAFTGTLDLTGLTGATSFLGGVELKSGALRISDPAQLGTTLRNVSITGNSTIIAAAGSAVNFAYSPTDTSGTNRLFLSTVGITTTLKLEPGASMNFTGYNLGNDNGGVIRLAGNNAKLVLDGTDGAGFMFDGNKITGNGGAAIAITSTNSTLNVTNATFQNNTATHNGGAILSNSGTTTLILNNVLFKSNTAGLTAGTGGGAICLTQANATLTVTSATFQDNSVAAGSGTGGGAILLLGANNTASFNQVTFLRNSTAPTRAGGAVLLNNTTVFSFTNGLFQENSAGSAGGGAIYVNGNNSKITLDGSLVLANSTTGTGGAILITGNTNTLTLNNTSFLNNIGAAGLNNIGAPGAIFITGNNNIVNINVSAGSTSRIAGSAVTAGGDPAYSLTISTPSTGTAFPVTITTGSGGTFDMLDPFFVSQTNSGGLVNIIKTGAGTWKLSGTSIYMKQGQSSSTKQGIFINSGTLYLYAEGEQVADPNAPGGFYTAHAGAINFQNAALVGSPNANAALNFTLAAGANLSVGGGNAITYTGNNGFAGASGIYVGFTLANHSNLTFNLGPAAAKNSPVALLSVNTFDMPKTAISLVTSGNFNPYINLTGLNLDPTTGIGTLAAPGSLIGTYNLFSLAGTGTDVGGTVPAVVGANGILGAINFTNLVTSATYNGFDYSALTGLFPNLDITAGVTMATAATGTDTLWIKFDFLPDTSKVISWIAANSTWSDPANWVLTSSPSTPSKYLKGDAVNFDLATPGANTVTVAADATVAGMYVSGNADYTFGGAGAIITDGTIAKTPLAGTPVASGKLILGAKADDTGAPGVTPTVSSAPYAGTLTLANTGANLFTNGIDINSGQLVGNTLTLGIGASASIAIAATGTLTYNQTTNASLSTPITGQGTLNKTGTATLTLAADYSAFTGAANINAGRLLLGGTTLGSAVTVNAGAFGGDGSVLGAVTVNTGTLLVGKTTLGSLALAPGSILDYASMTNPLTVLGAVTQTAPTTLINVSATAAGLYKLVDATTAANWGSIAADGSTFGINYNGALLTSGYHLAIVGQYLQLTFDYAGNNRILTWTGLGTPGQWRDTLAAENWLDNLNTIKTFTNGDVVNLTGNAPGAIAIATPVTVAAMYVNGAKSYAITGESITADSAAPATDLSGTAVTGKLILGKNATNADVAAPVAFTGTLDFTGQNAAGANNFKNGVEIDSGVLRISSTDQLGTTLLKLTFGGSNAPGAAPATLQIAKNTNVVFSSAGGTSNRLTLANNTAANFVLEDGATLTFSNNNPFGTGGAINTGTNTSLTFITGSGAQLIFTSNTGVNAAQNGGDAGAIFINTGAKVVIGGTNGGTVLFDSNVAQNRGGALFIQSGTLVLFGGAFTGNHTNTGNGGAIAALTNSRVELTDVTFTNNAGGMGGGIFANTNSIYVVQSATFIGNSATSTGANNGGGAVSLQNSSTAIIRDFVMTGNWAISNGGAIYLGSNNNTVNLNVSAGSTSRIAGNTSGAVASATASGVGFAAYNNMALNVDVAAAGALDMVDPMSSVSATTAAIAKTGAGVWNLGGASNLNASTAASAGITFNVNAGALHLYSAPEAAAAATAAGAASAVTAAGSIKLTGATSSFTLANTATLSAGGGNTIAAPAITLGANTTLALDLTGATPAAGLATDYSVLTLNATTLTSGWNQNLLLTGLGDITDSGTYNLISLTGVPAASYFTAISTFSATTGLLPGFTLGIGNAGSLLQLVAVVAGKNAVLTWTGNTGNLWSAANWMTPAISSATFKPGDIINLDSTNATNDAITVDTTTTATVAGIYVSGNHNYTITGTSIEARAGVGTLSAGAAATGKLVLGARALDDASGTTAPGYAGTLTLDNGSNNFAGGIVINSGELVGNDQTLGAGTVGILNNGTLSFNQTATGTYAAPITGAGILNKNGAGALTLANADTASVTNVNAGALLLAPAATLSGAVNVNAATFGGAGAATGAVTVAPTGTLMAGSSHTAGTPETLAIGGNLTLNPGSTLLFNTFDAGASSKVTAGTLTLATPGILNVDITSIGTGTYTLITAGAFDPNAAALTNASFHTTQAGSPLGARVNASYLVNAVPNTIQLTLGVQNIANTWTGNASNIWASGPAANWSNASDTQFYNGDSATFTATGTIAVDAAAGVQAAGMTVTTAGTLTFTGGAITTSTATNLPAPTGALTVNGAGLVILANSGTNNFTAGINITSGTLQGTTNTLATAGTTTVSAGAALVYNQAAATTGTAQKITGAGSLAQIGPGNLTLAGTTNYAGVTTLAAGSLTLANANQIASSSTVTLASGTLLTGANAQLLNELNGAGNITGSGSLTLANATAPTTYSGTISGGASITKTGANTLILAGNNADTGLTIATGTVQLGNAASAAGAVSGSINIASGAALALNHGSASGTMANLITGAGLLNKVDTGTLTLTANSGAFTGTTNIATGGLVLSNASLGGQLNLSANTNLIGSGTLGSVTTLGSSTITIGLTHGATPATTATLALTGTPTLAPATTLRYDLIGSGSPGANDLITAAALAPLTGTDTISIAINTSLSGTYTLVKTTAAMTTTATGNLATLVNGGSLSTRSIANYVADGNNLNLIVQTNNFSGLVWDGTNGTAWVDTAVANWKNADGRFLTGDSVIFDSTRTGTNLVVVDAGGVKAVDMLVNMTAGGTYTFQGGAITTSTNMNSTIKNTATGALTLAPTNTGLAILNNGSNNFEAGIYIYGGTLQGSAANLGTSGSILNNSALIIAQGTNATYATAITGTGSLTKTLTGTLTLSNNANNYQGGINVNAGVLALTGTATASTGNISILANSALLISNAASYTVAKPLAGTGTLGINLTAATGTVALTGAGAGFTGVLNLGTSSFNLSGVTALNAATLVSGTGNTTTVGTGTQTLAGLTLNGGLLKFSTTIPADTIAGSFIKTGTLTLGTTGTVQINIPTGSNLASYGGSTSSLFAQASGTTLDHLVSSGTVINAGNVTSLTLVDQNSAPVAQSPATKSANITQNGVNVATGTYTYKLDATGGLNVNYALASLSLIASQTLALTPVAGDTGVFSATISGTGNLAIAAAAMPVTLAGANNFSGTTTVASGTLIAGANGALGAATNGLVLADNTGFNLNGKTQTLSTLSTGANDNVTLGAPAGALTVNGPLNTAASSTINLAGGTLNVAGGTVNGPLTGAGALNVTGGNLAVNGVNTGLTAATTIAASATATMGNLSALGTGSISLTAATSVLNVNNTAPGTLSNAISGAGALNLNGTGTTTISNTNTALTGPVAVNGPVVAASTAALGSGNITTGAAGSLTYTASGTIANNITGAGALNLAATTGTTTLAGNNTGLNTINALAGSNILAATANSLNSANLNLAAANVTLTQDKTALGNINMAGSSTLGFAPGLKPGQTATATSLKSTGDNNTIALNTDIGAPTPIADQIILPAGSANSGAINLVLNNNPAGKEPTITGTTPFPSNLITNPGQAVISGSGTIKNPAWFNDFNWNVNPDGTADIAKGGPGGSGSAIIANATGAMPLTWFAELDTLYKRLGDLHIDPREKPGLDLWARAYTQRLNVNDKDTLVPFNETQYGTEVGADFGGHQTGYGSALYAGGFIGYGSSNRDIDDMNNNSGNTTSYFTGAYVSLIYPDGWYVDIVGKYNSFKNKFNSDRMSASYRTNAFGASVEAGRRMELGGGWYVTPSAQAALVRIAASDYMTDPGTNFSVNQAKTASRQLKAGALAGYKVVTKNGQIIQPYAKLYLAQQWTSGGEITVDGDTANPYKPTIKGFRVEPGIGVNWQVLKSLQIYFDYECAFARDYTKPYGLNLGANYAW